jgi:pyruvate-formate lyase-activating enzyme
MSKTLLLQLDGSLPNIALMRLAAHERARGVDVELRRTTLKADHATGFFERADRVYASLIFEKSRPAAEALLKARPDAIIGGTGWDLTTTLEGIGVKTEELDYSDFPAFRQSIGFTQRGCRLSCKFCVVPRKEGRVTTDKGIWDIWRKTYFDPDLKRTVEAPRELVLLDNDFFGQEYWRERVRTMRDEDFKVNFCQGINARMISDEAAEAIASLKYFDLKMKNRRIYTAWDNRRDEERLFDGLKSLVKHGVKPFHIMVYMLIGYWQGETVEDWIYRQSRLREFGALPYPMPYVRTPESVGFQRWVVQHFDKFVPWQEWKAADYQPRKLNVGASAQPTLFNDEVEA